MKKQIEECVVSAKWFERLAEIRDEVDNFYKGEPPIQVAMLLGYLDSIETILKYENKKRNN